MVLKILGVLFCIAALAGSALIYLADMMSDAPGSRVVWWPWICVLALAVIGALIFWSR